VLKRLLRDDEIARYDVVGLSGTSGGAICALLAWYALAGRGRVPAAELLDAFWADNSATSPHEQVLNSRTVWAGALQNVVSLPAVSPYLNPLASAGPVELRRMLEARVDFDALPDADRAPMLLIGAVDVLSGDFKAFNSRREQISARRSWPRRRSRRCSARSTSTAEPIGTACSRRIRPFASSSTLGPTRSGSSRSTPRTSTRSHARPSRSPTGATSCRATYLYTRSCASSRRSISCSKRARSRATACTARSWFG
jgi:hypothetical protein